MIILWREFIPAPAEEADLTTFDDKIRNIAHMPAPRIPGFINVEIHGQPSNMNEARKELQKMIEDFPFEREKRYTIKIEECREAN